MAQAPPEPECLQTAASNAVKMQAFSENQAGSSITSPAPRRLCPPDS